MTDNGKPAIEVKLIREEPPDYRPMTDAETIEYLHISGDYALAREHDKVLKAQMELLTAKWEANRTELKRLEGLMFTLNKKLNIQAGGDIRPIDGRWHIRVRKGDGDVA